MTLNGKEKFALILAVPVAVAAIVSFCFYRPTPVNAQEAQQVQSPAPAASNRASSRGSSDYNASHAQAPVVLENGMSNSLYHATKYCRSLLTELSRLQGDINICNQKSAYPASHAACLRDTAGNQHKIDADIAKIQQAGCSTDPNTLDSDYYQAVSKAAESGNSDAQMCLVVGDFRLSTPETIANYQMQSRRYIAQALARGDWRAVALMATPSESIMHSGSMMSNLPIIGKPFTVYRMNKLLSLGATGIYKGMADAEANNAAANLTPQQKAQGAMWAQQEFNKYFSNSPILTAPPVTCAAETGSPGG